MALVQAARFLQYYRRLASLKQAFDADLQDVVLPTMEFFRPDAPDLSRPRGEDLIALLPSTVNPVAANSAFIGFRPSNSGNVPSGRAVTILVIEQLIINVGTLATSVVVARLVNDSASPIPAAGWTKGLLTDSRSGSGPASSQSEFNSTTSPVALVGNSTHQVPINGAGSQPSVIIPVKIVLFPPMELVVINTTVGNPLTAGAYGYERTLELQEVP